VLAFFEKLPPCLVGIEACAWTNQMEAKRLSLLHELVPGVQLVGVLANPRFPPTAQELEDIGLAGKAVNQRLFVASANDDAELDAALTSFTQHNAGAFLVAAAPFFDTRLHRIVEFAAEKRLPGLYQFREYAVAGGLISRVWVRAVQFGRFLKGSSNFLLPICSLGSA
jgi:putative tryptophan/tyrosine transport system substrate-binding protein